MRAKEKIVKEQEKNFCVDCEYYELQTLSSGIELRMCLHPKWVEVLDPITKKPICFKGNLCKEIRKYDVPKGYCKDFKEKERIDE